MIRRLLRPHTLVIVFLTLAAVALSAAWKVQHDAADLLAEARAINAATVPESDTAAPSADVNREIIDNLDRAVVVRATIDSSLRQILDVVRGVGERQSQSRALLSDAAASLDAITAHLGDGVGAAEGSSSGLTRTTRSLRVSFRLARAIAEELEELDRKLGPTTP